MLEVRDAMLIIDSTLLEMFDIEDGLQRAKLCVDIMAKFGDLNTVDKKKVYELIVTEQKK
jgi:hypothetical protein